MVLDPTDGSVLAAVSDRRTAAEGGTPALEQMREPASIAKLITVTAALRAGIDVDAVLHDMTCRGSMRFGDGADDVLYCAAVNGKLRGLDRALAVSCNVAFAELGEMVGREKLLEEFRRYGFDFDGEESRFFGRVVTPEGHAAPARRSLDRARGDRDHAGARGARGGDGGERRLDASAALLSLDRHLPRVLGALAAGARGLAGDRRELAAAAHPGHDRGRRTRAGPRRASRRPSFPVALKTGTASEPSTGFHVNYIGFGPVPETRFAFAVRVTHQPSSRRVRSAAFAVTRRLLEGLSRFEVDRSGGAAAPRRATARSSRRSISQAAGGG